MSEFKKMKLSEARAKFEQIDEISDETKARYKPAAKASLAKANSTMWLSRDKADHAMEKVKSKLKAKHGITDDGNYSDKQWHAYQHALENHPSVKKHLDKEYEADKTAQKRRAGIDMLTKDRWGRSKITNEEAEQIDELKDETMKSYADKSFKAADRAITAKNTADNESDREKARRTAEKRVKGLGLATQKRLVGMRNEEVELEEKAPPGAKYERMVKDIKKSYAKDGLTAREKAISYATAWKAKKANEETELAEMGDQDSYGDPNSRYGKPGSPMAKNPSKPIPAKQVSKSFTDVLNKNMKKEETEGCMLDTSMGGADQIATSKTGEIYKKSAKQSTGPSPATGTSSHVVAGKSGEAYNTTGITKRVPAVESAALDVYAKTLEKRRIFEDASNIAIISPDQRQDWLNVSTGKMDVVDYFTKYKV